MTKKILLSPPVFAETESKNILSALSQEQISTYGNFISKFEEGLRGYSKGYQTAATNSGTSALHLAMRLLGVGSGDEVVCQSFTFCATANPVCYQGAMPVFVDSERETWNIDPNALEEAIEDRMLKGKKPKAIVVVDLYGMPASYDDILSISNRFEIPLVEDAAEALGSTYKGQSCSSFGAFGVFSFNGNKIITTGSGGCLVSPDANAIEQARYLSLQAKDQVHFYRHQEIGYNYYMNNLSAAVGLAQLERLPEKIGKRRAIFSRYVEMLGDCNGISFLEEPANVESNRWLTTILIEGDRAGFDREDVRLALADQNIESRYLWNPLHLQPVFKDNPFYGGHVAEDLYNMGLCLPSGENLTEDDQERIVGIIRGLYRK